MHIRKPRPQLAKRRVQKIGMPPGSLIYTGDQKLEQVRIRFLDYDEKHITEKEVTTIDECFPLKDSPTVSWVNIDGLHDVEIVEKLGQRFDIHPMLLEDVLCMDRRPKHEEARGTLLVILRMLRYDDEHEIINEQISFILGRNFVISFQEDIGDVFEPLRERIRLAQGKIRARGADYLLYSMLDAVVDSYFAILEKIGDRIEILEDELLKSPTEATLHKIHHLKREMVTLRRTVWPLRELISEINRTETTLIQENTYLYLRDLYDDSMQIIDTVEGSRDSVSSMLDLYLSSMSHRMNSVMQVLTVLATIFIPLTFVAGIYGMNFEYMPELHWKYGYAAIWCIMLSLALGMLAYFKYKKWI